MENNINTYISNESDFSTNDKNESNNVIFVKNLNLEVTENLLEVIFNKFKGFSKLKYMNNYAIIEFDVIENAAIALNETNNKKVTQNCRIQVVYANK